MFALVTAGLLAALSCKSFATDEHVYTGSSTSRGLAFCDGWQFLLRGRFLGPAWRGRSAI